MSQIPSPLFEYVAVDGPRHIDSVPFYVDMPVDRLLQVDVGAQAVLRKSFGTAVVQWLALQGRLLPFDSRHGSL